MNIIEKLATTNKPGYNIDKTIEEIFELGEKLMKRKIKDNHSKAPTDQEIIEEIGDVQIRLDILKVLFGQESVDERVKFKLNKYQDYIDNNLYIGSI